LTSSLEARFQAALEPLLAGADRARLGLAVSGGSDSTALMVLAAARGVEVATVDHRLRPEAADEAAEVGRKAARLGRRHEVLVWSHEGVTGNIPGQARRARYDLLATWARRRDLTHILIGHTADDLAETLLMRLGREAGLDGLAAMREVWTADDVTWLRPLLGFGREELRAFLREKGETWIDDPTNDDATYDRVKIRQALDLLAPLGISRAGLAQSARYLAEAKSALTALLAERASTLILSESPLTLVWPGFAAMPPEARRRLLAAALMFVARADYPPRREALLGLLARLETGETKTELHGVWVERRATHLILRPQHQTTWRQPADFITFLSTH
jgi:tRNA(Ile)-lysidine synthase